jgi:hypothetical protein
LWYNGFRVKLAARTGLPHGSGAVNGPSECQLKCKSRAARSVLSFFAKGSGSHRSAVRFKRNQILTGCVVSTLQTDSLSIAEFSRLFGFSPDSIVAAVEAQRRRLSDSQAYFSIHQLAARWSVSKGTVYAALQDHAAKALNVGRGSQRKKLLVPVAEVLRIEKARTERL